MKIKSVSISGFNKIISKKTYNFQNINYLYGLNGVGKSTILEAIQLALIGYIPGESKTASNIMTHSNSDILSVQLVLDDSGSDITINRSWQKSGTSVVTSFSIDPEMEISEITGNSELLVYDFGEFLNLSSNKAKDWFIHFLPSINSTINWRLELQDAVSKITSLNPNLIDETLEEFSKISSNDPITTCQKANEILKSDLSYKKGELQKVQSTIQSLIRYDDIEDTEAVDIREIQSQIDDIQNKITKIKETQLKEFQNKNLREQIDAIHLAGFSAEDDPDIKKNNITIQEKQNYLLETEQKLKELDENILSLNKEIVSYSNAIRDNESIINGKGICPYTKTNCESISNLSDKLQEQCNELKDNKERLQKALDEYTIQKANINKDSQSAISLVDKLNKENSNISHNYKLKETLINQLVPVEEISDMKSISEYEIDIQKLNDILIKVQANKKYDQLIDKLTADKYQIENEIDAYKAWIKLTGENGLQTRLMTQPFVDMEADMNKYLNILFDSNITCKFILSNKANSFSFGIVRDNVYIPYTLLSSGEKTLYTFALMLYIISKADSKLKLLLMDDMLDHLDDDAADKLFKSLSSIDETQVIMAGVKKSTEFDNYLIEI